MWPAPFAKSRGFHSINFVREWLKTRRSVAAVFYKFRTVLNQLCSQGFIVDAGPLGTFRPTFTSKVVAKEKDFKPMDCISKAYIRFTPTADFRRLKHVQFYRVTKLQKKAKPSGGGLPGSGT